MVFIYGFYDAIKYFEAGDFLLPFSHAHIILKILATINNNCSLSPVFLVCLAVFYQGTLVYVRVEDFIPHTHPHTGEPEASRHETVSLI